VLGKTPLGFSGFALRILINLSSISTAFASASTYSKHRQNVHFDSSGQISVRPQQA
jgi:hypothetical protein